MTTTTLPYGYGELMADGKHKYGGTIYRTTLRDGKVAYVGVVAATPKTYREMAPTEKFISNDWDAPAFIDGHRNEAKVQYHATRKQAMARLEDVMARMNAAYEA